MNEEAIQILVLSPATWGTLGKSFHCPESEMYQL